MPSLSQERALLEIFACRAGSYGRGFAADAQVVKMIFPV